MPDQLALIDCLPDAVSVHRDGRILFVNRTWLAWLGYLVPEDVVARPILDFVRPEDRHVSASALRELVERGPPIAAREEGLIRADGTVLETEVAVHYVPFQGRPAVVAISRDVTERKRLEAVRAEMHARLLVSERMAAVGTLAAGMAHEINSPLGALIACLETMDEMLERQRWEGLEDALDDAREGAERVRMIVRDLGTFSRAGDGPVAPVDVRRVLESAVHLARNQVRHRGKLVKQYGPVPLVHASEHRLGQVFVHLLVNAAQALPDSAQERREIHLTTRTDAAGRAVVEVRDTRVGGLTDARLPLMDTFLATQGEDGGAGLGLSISRSIVRSLAGEIEATTEGGGTTFRVVLPAASSVAAGVAQLPSTSDVTRARILVVDDDAAFGRSLHRLLQEDHDVVLVESGEDALAFLARDRAFDLILCDLMMPSLSGGELYEAIRKKMPDLLGRFALMTGGAFTPGAQAFLQKTAVPCLDKPIDTRELRDLIRSRAGRAA